MVNSKMDSEPVWDSVRNDPVLSRPPSPGQPGHAPLGEDLRLDISWDRFEQLLVALAHGAVGLNQKRFRRYGVEGQAQHGIDLSFRWHVHGSAMQGVRNLHQSRPASRGREICRVYTPATRNRCGLQAATNGQARPRSLSGSQTASVTSCCHGQRSCPVPDGSR